MIKLFKPSEEVNVKKMQKINSDLRLMLKKIFLNEIPNNDYTIEDLQNFCISLIKGQRNSQNLTGIKPGSWCVAPNADEMGSDARVDFAFYPTYVIIAILTKIKMDYPYFAARIENYDKVLKLGMKFSTYRELYGHGYEGFEQLLDAILIFGEGSIYQFLKSDKDYCPELLKILESIKIELTDRINNGSTKTFGYEIDVKEIIIMALKIFENDVASNISLENYAKNTNEAEKYLLHLDTMLSKHINLPDEIKEVIQNFKHITKSQIIFLDKVSNLINKINEIRTTTDSDDIKLFEISNYLTEEIEVHNPREYINDIEKWLKDWNKLEYDSIKFLTSAEQLIKLIEQRKLEDYSPTIIQFCRTLENEILKKIFAIYNEDFNKRIKNKKDFIKQDLINKTTENFAKKLNKDELNRCTLGEMNFILNLLKSDGDTYKNSNLLKDFKEFIFKYFEANILEQKYLDQIDKITKNYRNKAAHPSLLDFNIAVECKNKVKECLINFILNYKI